MVQHRVRKGKCDPYSWHVALFADDGTSREYTPVSTLDEWCREGRLRIAIKVYARGKFTSWLARDRPAGTTLRVGKPRATVRIEAMLAAAAAVRAAAGLAPDEPADALLVAGGTGFAPVLQLARHLVELASSPATSGIRRVFVAVSHSRRADDIMGDEFLRLQRACGGVLSLLRAFTREAAEAPAEGVVHHRLDEDTLRGFVGGQQARVCCAIVSGPQSMLDHIGPVLRRIVASEEAAAVAVLDA